jgi:hypothetical protein
VRELTDDDVANLYRNAQTYAQRQAVYKTELKRIG